jgi:hypothetical protein
MTEQLYRRKAGEPVRVWRVGDGEPPEWVVTQLLRAAPGMEFPDRPAVMRGSVILHSDDYPRILTAADFARDYEPLPAPAPDAVWRVVRRILSEHGIGAPREVAEKIALSATLAAYAAIEAADTEEPAPAPDAREALEIAREALEQITKAHLLDMSPASERGACAIAQAIAHAALAKLGDKP